MSVRRSSRRQSCLQVFLNFNILTVPKAGIILPAIQTILSSVGKSVANHEIK